ncbi:MAG TPA: OsmC family protein [Usitatibacteraceae bacterium]|nr:OsmC family protein [Usitatibacteraceae bacterium]
MADTHVFETSLEWPADPAQLLPPDPAFSRDNILRGPGKPDVPGSAPAVFSGDPSRYNPEELLLLSLSHCHMLTYLAIAARKRWKILAYRDQATGTLGLGAHGTAGKMSMQEVVLRPVITLPAGTDLAEATSLHEKAHANCFMANSVNFPVRIEPTFLAA